MLSPRLVAKIESEEPTLRLAVLIDADNAQAKIIENLLKDIALSGEAVVKRIYGDFTSQNSSSWKKVLQKYSIKPIQQFSYTTGKNSTDSALIIDAMDLLYTQKFDGFCLVTSDSDFTGLAIRIREAGLVVFGYGEEKTPDAFRNACHKFIPTELLRSSSEISVLNQSQEDIQIKSQDNSTQSAEFPKKFILDALRECSNEDGWVHLGTLGSYLTKLKPDFDSRAFGSRKLSDLIKSKQDLFEVEERPVGSGHKALYVRGKISSL